MQVQVNSDNNIQHNEELESWVTGVVDSALAHTSGFITRVEVHLSDENGNKSGPRDMRCMMEARVEGRKPVAVTAHSDTLHRAVNDASGKLSRMIESGHRGRS